jgi:multidrug resistance efflux pump
MEVIITIAYYFFIRMIFVDFKLLKLNVFWWFVIFAIYIAAAMTEVVGLGQYTPYSEECYLQSYVVPMSPEYGGLLKSVDVKSNQMLKKGDTLFQMDPTEWQLTVNELEAQLAAAGTNLAVLSKQVEEEQAAVDGTQFSLDIAQNEYNEIAEAAKQKAVAQITVEQYAARVNDLKTTLAKHKAALRAKQIEYASESEGQPTEIALAVASLEKAKYNLAHTAVLAPTDGYVSNLQIHPGGFIRLKQPIMSFVSTDDMWLMTQFTQFGIHHISVGDPVEVAFRMYPGDIFHGTVEEVYWSNGNAQGHVGAEIPKDRDLVPGNNFRVRIKMDEQTEYPLRFGSSGIAAIYTKHAADFIIFLRQLEIQSESFLNYVYNPFR